MSDPRYDHVRQTWVCRTKRVGTGERRAARGARDLMLGADLVMLTVIARPDRKHFSLPYGNCFVMHETVSAADANRGFSVLLRAVREGRSYVVTHHGQPVARLIPASRHDVVAANARAALLARLERQPVVDAGRWTREELYDDD